MKKLVCALGALVCCSALSARTIHVSSAGGGDGSGWGSETTLAAALAAAADNDEIWLKVGEYALTDTLTTDKAVALIGGFAGNEASADARTGTARSVIDGGSSLSVPKVLSLTAASGKVTLDRLVLRNGYQRGLSKEGDADLELENCWFVGNGKTPGASRTDSATVLVRGRGAYVVGTSARTARVTVRNCRFEDNCRTIGNTYAGSCSDAGSGACFENLAGVVLTDTAFVGNGLRGLSVTALYQATGRDQSTHGAAFYANSAPVAATNCTMIGNRETVNNGSYGDGGIVVLAGACGGSVLSHCVIAGNDHLEYSDQSNAYGPALGIKASDVSQVVLVDHCTIAYNIAERSRCSGLYCHNGTVRVTNSILYGNVADSVNCLGAEIFAGSASAKVFVDYSVLPSSGAPYVGKSSGATVDLGAHMNYGDARLAVSFAEMSTKMRVAVEEGATMVGRNAYSATAVELEEFVDVHLKSPSGRWTGTAWVSDDVLSPAVDAGDPSDPSVGQEPLPNGEIVNAGRWGGTSEASKNKVVAPVIASAQATMSGDYTRPQVSFSMEAGDDYSASAVFCYGHERPEGGGAEGWEFVQGVTGPVVAGGTYANIPALRYFPDGDHLYWRVIVTVGTKSSTFDGELDISGEMPPAWGRGLGEDVIHVWAGGQGSCGGTNWLDAVPDLGAAAALLSPTRRRIAVAGTVRSRTKVPEFVGQTISVVGGFTGMENSFEDRVPGSKSTVDGGAEFGGLRIVSTPSGLSSVEGLILTNVLDSGIYLTGSGSFAFTDCEVVDCGRSELSVQGRGLNVTLDNRTSVLAFTNCVFRGNCQRLTGTGPGSIDNTAGGNAVYLNVVKRTIFADCAFDGNGFPIVRHDCRQVAPGRDNTTGWVIWSNSPVVCERCCFRGNAATMHTVNGSSLFHLSKLAGGSVFRNCSFTGNQGLAYQPFPQTLTGGMFWINLDRADDGVRFENCTVAYNAIECAVSPFLSITKGSVTLDNSIVWGNFGWTNVADFARTECTTMLGKIACLCTPDAHLAVAHSLLEEGDGIAPRFGFLADVPQENLTVGDGVIEGDPLLVTDYASVTNLLYVRVEHATGYRDSKDIAGDTMYVVFKTTTDRTAFNCHLRGRDGYTDEATGETVKFKRQESPAIDAGDPAADFSREPLQRNGRLNLGFYGNTPWATLRWTPPGMIMICK